MVDGVHHLVFTLSPVVNYTNSELGCHLSINGSDFCNCDEEEKSSLCTLFDLILIVSWIIIVSWVCPYLIKDANIENYRNNLSALSVVVF